MGIIIISLNNNEPAGDVIMRDISGMFYYNISNKG